MLTSKSKTSSLLLLSLVLLTVSCSHSQPRYQILSQSELELKQKNNVVMVRGVTIPYYYDEFTIKDATLRNELKEDIPIFKAASFIKNEEFSKLFSYLNSFSENEVNKSDALKLCWGLYYFFNKDYLKANDFFAKSNDNDYYCLSLLLKADCVYELNKASMNRHYEESTENYQKAFDCTNNKYQQDMIKWRVKYARYGE